MPIKALDHVNIRTSRLDEMVAWYGKVLDIHPGDRPAFSIPGAWLYVGGLPSIHLVGVTEEPADHQPKLEHYALSATGMRDFLAKLRAHDVSYSIDPVPGFPIVQVNFRDIDGNHIHIDFPSDEAEGLS